MRPGIVVNVTPADRRRLEALVGDRNAAQKHVWRARIVLLSAAGLGTNAIMRQTAKSKTCVWRWQERFAEEGFEGLLRDKMCPSRVPPLGVAQGSVFTRETLKERERRQIEILADRLQQDLGTLALQAAQAAGSGAEQASETVAIGQSLLADLRNTQPVGRLVIDLDRIMAAEPGSPVDVILKDGDVLRVPQTAQEVTVIGEVQNSTSHLYDPALARTDYIRLSGGTTQKADNGRIYVVRANGSVEMGGGSRWFRDSGSMQPGDTVVVPLDAERMRPLPLWTAVSTILYNIAISVAAVNSF